MEEVKNDAEYLGDGVYVSDDGYHIWLDTRGQLPNNKIALEPEVFEKLVKYVKHNQRRVK